jgi:hypothetical protein
VRSAFCRRTIIFRQMSPSGPVGSKCEELNMSKSAMPHYAEPNQTCRYVLRQKSNFANHINLIWPVQSFAQKHFSFVFSEIVIDCPHSAPTQGAYRDRHERGAECGGRGLC